ncbi:hypothetical protein C8R45DRAFT_933370, partial [Mycena sanguinolenta]
MTRSRGGLGCKLKTADADPNSRPQIRIRFKEQAPDRGRIPNYSTQRDSRRIQAQALKILESQDEQALAVCGTPAYSIDGDGQGIVRRAGVRFPTGFLRLIGRTSYLIKAKMLNRTAPAVCGTPADSVGKCIAPKNLYGGLGFDSLLRERGGRERKSSDPRQREVKASTRVGFDETEGEECAKHEGRASNERKTKLTRKEDEGRRKCRGRADAQGSQVKRQRETRKEKRKLNEDLRKDGDDSARVGLHYAPGVKRALITCLHAVMWCSSLA